MTVDFNEDNTMLEKFGDPTEESKSNTVNETGIHTTLLAFLTISHIHTP